MNYNIEKINGIAEKLAEIIEEAIAAEDQSEIKIGGVEMALRESLREIGEKTLVRFLENADKEWEGVSKIECTCGGKLKYQRKRPATIWSVFGKVKYERAYYAGCRCREGQAPLDKKYGLTPGKVTGGLADLVGMSGIDKAFKEGQKWLQSFLLFEVSENTILAETEMLGAIQQQMDDASEKAMQDETELQKRERDQRQAPERLYGSIDAAKVRIEPRDELEKALEGRENWRDLKIVCWYQGEIVPNREQSTRQKRKVQRTGTVIRAKGKEYYCDISEADEFGKLLWATGCSVGADRAKVLVFVCDGAVWIWNLVDYYFSNAVQIVDWYHAEDHLKGVATEAFQTLEERQAWLKPVVEDLWQGRVESVIAACQKLSLSSDLARKAALYFSNNCERMRYADFRAKGFLIGSGVIESGCKQIVSRRLKVPGAQWTLDGAILTAKARAAWLSGKWQSLLDARSRLPLVV